MFEILNSFDRTTAAGILARAALALEDHRNPGAKEALEGESGIRKRLFQEARHLVGVDEEE